MSRRASSTSCDRLVRTILIPLALALVAGGIIVIAGNVIAAVFWPALAVLAGYCLIGPYMDRRL